MKNIWVSVHILALSILLIVGGASLKSGSGSLNAHSALPAVKRPQVSDSVIFNGPQIETHVHLQKIRNGSTYLSTHLSANDYYCEQEQVSGLWVGKGAERLGIAGQAIGKEDSAFEALRLNQHPNGSGKLTPRNVTNSIRFFDFQCAPH